MTDSSVADVFHVLVLMAAPAGILVTIRYLNRRAAQSDTAIPGGDDGSIATHPNTDAMVPTRESDHASPTTATTHR
jgi:hypothetical protein